MRIQETSILTGETVTLEITGSAHTDLTGIFGNLSDSALVAELSESGLFPRRAAEVKAEMARRFVAANSAPVLAFDPDLDAHELPAGSFTPDAGQADVDTAHEDFCAYVRASRAPLFDPFSFDSLSDSTILRAIDTASAVPSRAENLRVLRHVARLRDLI